MPDPRFYKVAGPFNLFELAEISGSALPDGANPSREFADVSPLETATEQDVSFIDNRKYVDAFLGSKAGAILTPPDLVDSAPSSAILLINKQPYLGYAKLTQAFYPVETPKSTSINPTANIDPSAKIGGNVQIDSGVVIGPGVEIGDQSMIGPNTYIGHGVVIGSGCKIGSNVTLIYCIIGNNNIIHGGVCIGQDGYGFAPGMPRHIKVHQLGRVLTGEDVEIGANTAIDRGAGPDTIIGDGTKIDNLVHVAHNVQIGRGCFITGQNGFAGSAVIGDYVMMGGQVGISGHITIGDGVQIAAQSGVSSDIAAGEVVAGTPAQNAREHWKGLAMLRKLVKAK